MKLKKKLVVISIVVFCLLVLTIIKAFTINGKDLKVREETLKSEKIDSNLDELLICYFADLNYGTNLKDEDILKIENTINDFKPDIILFGGDLLKDKSLDYSVVKNLMTNISAKYGKYAILGEEDVNDETTSNLLEESGFIILNNTNRKLYCDGSFINIVGIAPSISSDLDIIAAYEGVNPNYYTIVLSHMPDTFDKLDKTKTDYVLSSHTLGGPVYVPLFDLFYRPSGGQSYFRNKYKVDGLTLDISSGLGTKKNNVRMFSDEEIVLYKMKG